MRRYGVSQSAGHHIANNQLFKRVIGLNDTSPEGKYKIGLLGEYNIGGDGFLLDELFEKCGITVTATFSGNSTMDNFERAHTADLNCVMCHRSINYVADMIEKKYGVPWIKVSFLGADAAAKSLRKIAAYFEELHVDADPENYRPRITEEQARQYEAAGNSFKDYEGMMSEMSSGTMIIDDINQYESEVLIEKYRPAIFCAGIKEKYSVQKGGIPCLQLHSYDYGGPFASFGGACNFYRTIDRMVNSKVWSFVEAPWQADSKPALEAAYVSG